jgi:hypothetical protein
MMTTTTRKMIVCSSLLYGQVKSERKKRKFDHRCEEKSPASCLALTAFIYRVYMNRNEDERMSNLSLLLLLIY